MRNEIQNEKFQIITYFQTIQIKVLPNLLLNYVLHRSDVKLEGAVPIMGTHSTGIDWTAISPDP